MTVSDCDLVKSYASNTNPLPGSVWTRSPTVPGAGSTLTLTDSTASSTQRFYRVNER